MKFNDLNLRDVGNSIQLVGAIYAGNGKIYQCIFPGEETQTSQVMQLETLEMTTEEWTRFLCQTDLMETEILSKAKDGEITKAIYRKSQRQIDQNVAWGVFRRDKYKCRYCAAEAPLTVDHLVRWEEGGPTTPENLLSACRSCNRARGDMPYAVWLRNVYYLKKSDKLDDKMRKANEDLSHTLDKIERVYHVRSR